MNQLNADTERLLERCHFIMTRPSHPGNVGAAARALKTMGFSRLDLVAPRHPNTLEHPEAVAMASRATDLLASASVSPDLASALGPITLSFALTARPRDIGPRVCDIRQAAALAKAHLLEHSGGRVAVVLGTERTGLQNDEISHCHCICHIPANPHYSSLNVAQALQLAAWELRYALLDSPLPPTAQKQPPEGAQAPAPQAQMEALFEHWQHMLEAVEFLDPANPRKLMLKMQHWLMSSNLSIEQCQMLRGVCTQVLKHAARDPEH